MIDYCSDLKGRTVLVTGGLGFIGQNICRELINKYDCDLIVVDDLSNSSVSVLNTFTKHVEFHHISVTDIKKLGPLMLRCSYIFHLACKQIAASSSDAIEDLNTNALSTLQMLDFIKNNHIPGFRRFLYSSSCSIYGSANIIPTPEHAVPHTRSNYAATKLLGDNYTLLYNSMFDIPTTVVRYSNVYGRGQTPDNPYCGVIGKFVYNSLKGNPLTVFGNGDLYLHR